MTSTLSSSPCATLVTYLLPSCTLPAKGMAPCSVRGGSARTPDLIRRTFQCFAGAHSLAANGISASCVACSSAASLILRPHSCTTQPALTTHARLVITQGKATVRPAQFCED